jgi:predicted RNase H-like HicB family nuclease
MTKYVYPACFYEEDDGRYAVDVPDFGLSTFGDDLPDAIFMAADAIAGRISLAFAEGEPLPEPSSISDIVPDDASGFTSMVCADMDAWSSANSDHSVKKTLTIPSWLNTAAERQKINFSATLKDALMRKLA